ncbi:Uu.00g080500.m01.CDS01 [Anthostomella pinea]|uniref:Uu.00g080500.m01.CDS01 n=1 Tax=Anthostomella pinea TaxID=933095 RepID=A0AAI8VKZ3_9PEZI|nr:Uu.00g080500.m01.CDS01 [Anthostomella pinea]
MCSQERAAATASQGRQMTPSLGDGNPVAATSSAPHFPVAWCSVAPHRTEVGGTSGEEASIAQAGASASPQVRGPAHDRPPTTRLIPQSMDFTFQTPNPTASTSTFTITSTSPFVHTTTTANTANTSPLVAGGALAAPNSPELSPAGLRANLMSGSVPEDRSAETLILQKRAAAGEFGVIGGGRRAAEPETRPIGALRE